MKAVSPLLKRVVYPSLAKSGYLRRRSTDEPVVVTYHGVFPPNYKGVDANLDGGLVESKSLRRQLRLLKANYNIISPPEFLLWCRSEHQLPPRSVLLTCDDGLQNTLTVMLPVLKELDLSCLFFITGGSLGEKPTMLWHEELYLIFLAAPDSMRVDIPEVDVIATPRGTAEKRYVWSDLIKKLSRFDAGTRAGILQRVAAQLKLPNDWRSIYLDEKALGGRFRLLTLPELRELLSADMSIGGHTLSHPMLSQLPAQAAWPEIMEIRQGLQQALSCEVWAFAYPFGDPGSITRGNVEMVQLAGFDCAFMNVEDKVGGEILRLAFPRIHVTRDMSLSEFEAHVSGFYQALRTRLLGARVNTGLAS